MEYIDRTPAETGSPSEESNEDPVSSENNQVSSNADSHYGYDDSKHFNVSYHKSNQISKEDGIRGTTHIAELNAVPAYTFIVEEDLPLHTTKCESSLNEEVDARSSNANNIDSRMVGEHFWETTPTQVSSGNDQRSLKNFDGKETCSERSQKNFNGRETCSEKPFVTVSEISLRTQPCEVPPPSRLPPKLTTKHGYLKSATSNLKYTPNYTCHGANDCSPPFYDVDVDSSSAAASAAAMKEAMEIAQARLKSAKEMMERKKDCLRYRETVRLNDCKRDERPENEIAHDVRVKEDKLHIKLEKHGSDLNGFDRVGKGKRMGSHVSLDSEPQRGLVNFSKQYAEQGHPKECKLTQGFQRQEVIRECKAEEIFYELVKNDTVEKAFIAAENKSSKKKLMSTTTAYKHGENEMQAEEVDFVQQEISDGKLHEVKMACELEEDMKTLNVANVIGEREKHCQTTKAVQKICYQEEHEKSHNESWEEFGKLNKICAQENYEKKLDETHKQGKKDGHEGEEYLKKLKEAHEKKQKEGIEWDENEKKMKEVLQQEEGERREREACEREEFERKRVNFERGESERRQKEAHEKEKKEMGINESRQMESHQREENEKRQKEGCEREESGRSKESLEREQKEWNLKQAAEENKWRLKEIGEMEENEKRHKIIKMEEYEFFLTASDGSQKNECKSKQFTEENECELQSILENERRETEECEREENVNRFKVSYGREENERKLKLATEQNERMLNELQEREENMIHKDTHNHEKSEKRQNDLCEDEVIEKIPQKEACELVDSEKKLRDSQELKDKRPEEFCTCKSQNAEIETATGQEQINNAFERNENDRNELSQDIHLSEENMNLKADKLYVDVAEQKEELMAHGDVCMQEDIMNLEATHGGWEQEENIEQLKMDQDSCREATSGGWDQEENIEQLKLDPESSREATHGGWEQEETIEQLKTDRESCREESDNIMKIDQNASKHIEKVKNFKEAEVSYGLYKIKRAANMFHGCSAECEGNRKAALEAKKELGNIENTVVEERDEKCLKEVPGVLSFKDTRISVKTSQRMGQSMEADMKIEVVHPINEEQNRTNTKLADQLNTDQERKENDVKGNVAREVIGKEGRMKDREQERECLKKLEEDRLREREREKDRIAVEKVTREARERAFAETRERAERAAVERATAEVRQRAMLEARERLEKACAEARERSLTEKAYAESRLRAERAAVERATAEARERAVEKAMAERAAMETRVGRSVSEKFSAVSRDGDLTHSASFSDVRNPQFQSSKSFSSSQRYTNISNHSAFTNEKSQGTEVESAQRCKAKLERNQRTVERAAKALAEKNLRDQLAQREQAERNRLADTLDADVKRWSSGKEGNLRALLSTLQYILGPESGWQPIPLTDVITAVAAKKAYRKATLCVHPDKLQQRGASIQQKYVSEKVFDLLKDAWSKFNSEER